VHNTETWAPVFWDVLPLPQPGSAGGRGASALLSAVRGLQHLKHLSVCVDVHEENAQSQSSLSTAQRRDCDALTASPHLTYLDLSVAGSKGRLLPTAALQQMFPADRELPQLQHLVLRWTDRCRWFYGDAGSITTADLRSMVSACPGLCCLDLGEVVAQDADVSPLLQLPATCCSLKVAGHPFNDSAAGVIGQLTQLTQLVWTDSPGLTDAGLLSLMALQGLQSFLMRDLGAVVEEVELKRRGDKVRHDNLPASTQLPFSSAQHFTAAVGVAKACLLTVTAIRAQQSAGER
jgi:hypothetical protein